MGGVRGETRHVVPEGTWIGQVSHHLHAHPRHVHVTPTPTCPRVTLAACQRGSITQAQTGGWQGATPPLPSTWLGGPGD